MTPIISGYRAGVINDVRTTIAIGLTAFRRSSAPEHRETDYNMAPPPRKTRPTGGQRSTLPTSQTRRAARPSARAQQARQFRFISEHAPDAHFFIDRGARIRYVNAIARERLGYPGDELLGMTLADID